MFLRIGMIGMFLSLPGCASHRVHVPNYDAVGVAGDGVQVESMSIFGRKGFHSNHTDQVSRYCGKGQLTSVEVRRNALQGLLSSLTLGIVSPAKVIFYCGKEPIDGQARRGKDAQQPAVVSADEEVAELP